MKKSIKTSLVIISIVLVACLACLVWFVSRTDGPDEMVVTSVSGTSRNPAFEVRVERPRMDRPFGGILGRALEAKLFGGEPKFTHASPGARMGNVGQHRIELSADGWDLLIETDSEGRINPATRLVFPMELAEKQYSLRCRPADQSKGYLGVTEQAGSGEADVRLEGRFLVELARCEDARTGKILDTEAGGNPGQAWPSSPLTLRGSFVGPAARPSRQPGVDNP
jgi:hypothetical protein